MVMAISLQNLSTVRTETLAVAESPTIPLIKSFGESIRKQEDS
jgi:hypothetical protein